MLNYIRIGVINENMVMRLFFSFFFFFLMSEWNEKKKNITLPEQFRNQILKS